MVTFQMLPIISKHKERSTSNSVWVFLHHPNLSVWNIIETEMLKYAKSGESDETQNKSKLQQASKRKHRLVLAESGMQQIKWYAHHIKEEITWKQESKPHAHHITWIYRNLYHGKRSFHHKTH